MMVAAACMGVVLHFSCARAQNIDTVLGGSVGDGGPTNYAQLYQPADIVFDRAGNLYIADITDYRVRKVTPGGPIETIAGTGAYPYFAFGCPSGLAAQTPLNVASVTLDPTGNLVIGDLGSACIERLSADGSLSVVAGSGRFGYSGDGGDAKAALLSAPIALTFDRHGNLYFSDLDNNRIRKVDVNGVISTVAGSGSTDYVGDGGFATQAGLDTPYGVTVDGSDNLYIADTMHSVIRKVDVNGFISTFAGNGTFGYSGDGGAAPGAQLNSPHGLRIAPDGDLFIADSGNSVVRRIDAAGVITTVAGNGQLGISLDGVPATSVPMYSPLAIAFDDRAIIGRNFTMAIADETRVRSVASNGILRTLAGGATYPETTPALGASLFFPEGLAFDVAGNMYIADSANHRVRKLKVDGTVATVAGDGTLDASAGGIPATASGLVGSRSVVVDSAGNLYIADSTRIRKVDTNGVVTTFVGDGTSACVQPGHPETKSPMSMRSPSMFTTSSMLPMMGATTSTR